jgi:hypothetical protein
LFTVLEKKTLAASERNEEARRVWREEMKDVDANQLVLVDETGSNIGLTPLYAWAPKGQRAFGKVPRNYGKKTTLLASLSLVFHGSGDDPGRSYRYPGF